MNRHLRAAFLVLSTACLVAATSGLALSLHLADRDDDCCHEDSDHSHHDSEHCPICEAMLVRSAEYVVEPPVAAVLAEEHSIVAPSKGEASPQFHILSVLAPRPPPRAEV